MSTPARIYKITDTEDNSIHLVKASNPAQAIRHIAKTRFKFCIPSGIEIAERITAGGAVSDATKQEQESDGN